MNVNKKGDSHNFYGSKSYRKIPIKKPKSPELLSDWKHSS